MAPDEANKINIDHVMPGADVIRAGGHQIALGFPEEVVKAWLRADQSVDTWLIPDVRTANGIVQWALEFPLYHALFVQGIQASGGKITVLVHRRDWPDVVAYLRLGLVGLTRQEMKQAGVEPEIIELLEADTRYLALKNEAGEIASVEDFLAPCFFDSEGMAVLDQLRVRSHGDNTYSFFTEQDRIEEYRLEIDGEQQPPYSNALTPGSAPVTPQPLEVITLGAAHGFDVSGPCSNMLVQANGRFLLVDCGPYIRKVLNHSGVSLNQIDALVITHAHEDHAVGLSAMLGLTRRPRLFISRENALIMRRKLAILYPNVNNPGRLLDDAFDVVLVKPGEDHDLFGLGLRFHYTMHPIPCTGVSLSMGDGGLTRRVLIVGDNNSRANIEQALAEGAISARRAQELLSLYRWEGDLVIFDAGAGPIHGMPEDFADNRSAAVVGVHRQTQQGRSLGQLTQAEAGHRYTVVPERPRPTPLERGLAHRALREAFELVADADWLDALLNAATPESVNRGHLVIRQNERGRDVFVTLTGELAVLVDGPGGQQEVAAIHAGEIFGEMAAVNDGPRSASVVAVTPSRLLRIPAEVFRRFASKARLPDVLPELWAKRRDLESAGVLAGASVTTRNQFARRAVRRAIAPGSTLIREGSRSSTVFVLVQGRVQVYKGNAPLLVNGAPIIVEPGSLIGETAPFLKKARNASIVTVDECEVLAIRGVDFKKIVQRSPHLFFNISRVVQQRQAA